MVFLSASCTGRGGSDDAGGEKKIKIVTTLYAPYDFVRNIAGSSADVSMLLSPGEESHSYDPTPQDIINIGSCDLFIYNGGENEKWVDGVLESAGDNVRVLRMMDVVDKVYTEEIIDGMQPEGDMDNGDSGKAGAGEEYDEHVWTSLDNAIAISEAIRDEIAAIDPENESVYSGRLASYVKELSEVRGEIAQVVNGSKRKVLVFGDRFPMRYFTEEFGLGYYAAFPGCSADTEADAATIKFLIDKVNEEKIQIVLKNEMSSGTIADAVAAETGAAVRTLYACHNISKEDYEAGAGYVDLMKRNIEALEEALN